MNINIEALTIIIFLIPGLFSSLILNTLTIRQETSSFTWIIQSLIFSFFVYLLVLPFTDKTPILLKETKVDNITTIGFVFNISVLIPVGIICLVLPILLSYLIANDYHMNFFRKLRITNITARPNVWFDVFSDLGQRLVVVNFRDGKRVIGLPMYYSSNVKEQTLYLFKAAWLRSDGSHQKIEGHGLLIVRKEDIETIEFLNYPEIEDVSRNNGGH